MVGSPEDSKGFFCLRGYGMYGERPSTQIKQLVKIKGRGEVFALNTCFRLGCHRAKFNGLSVPAPGRTCRPAEASARGGNNGQVYAIRFQPICWRARVMRKHIYCASPDEDARRRTPTGTTGESRGSQRVVVFMGEEREHVYSQPGHRGSPGEAESRR